MTHEGSNIERNEHYGALQDVVDSLFEGLEAPEATGSATAASTEGATGAADPEGAGTRATDSPVPGASAAEAFGVSERAASLLGLGALLDGAQGESAEEAPSGPTVRRLDAVLAAEAADLPDDLMRIVRLLPPGDYTRERLCTQLNSALTGHAWGQVYGTVA